MLEVIIIHGYEMLRGLSRDSCVGEKQLRSSVAVNRHEHRGRISERPGCFCYRTTRLEKLVHSVACIFQQSRASYRTK